MVGQRLARVHLLSPFVLRTVDPPIDAIAGLTVSGVSRIGKRIVLAFEPELFLVIHLMIAGRLRWRAPGKKPGMGPKLILASLEFPARHVVLHRGELEEARVAAAGARSRERSQALDPGGLEPLEATVEQFHAALTRESHTLKRALTDPRLFSGIGNAYSDEILHAARLSPLKLTRSLSDAELARLHEATRATLLLWTDRLREQTGDGFPEKVTAFHGDMAVHGRFKQPCPVCGSPVQRIVYADNECNYCATCQTGGRLLADRALSRLLREDWPKRLED